MTATGGKKRKNILLCGYYGYHNAGDDAALASVLGSVRDVCPDADTAVLVGGSADGACLCGCQAVPRFQPAAVYGALRRCDALIFGGGSLLQDVTSTRSLLYYLFLLREARRMGKKTMLFGNGIGPVTGEKNRALVRRAVERVTSVTLRDAESLEELRRMGVLRPDIEVAADPVFSYRRQAGGDGEALLRAAGAPEGKPFAAVVLRRWAHTEAFCAETAAACDALSRRFGLSVVFLNMHPEYDRAISEEVRLRMRCASYLLPETDVDGLMTVIGRADLVLSMRLHALIFAARMGVPAAGIVYDPKLENFLAQVGMPSCGTVETFRAARAEETAASLLAGRAAFSAELRRRTAELERDAGKNGEALRRLLEA